MLKIVKPLTTSNTSEKCDFIKNYQILGFLPSSNRNQKYLQNDNSSDLTRFLKNFTIFISPEEPQIGIDF